MKNALQLIFLLLLSVIGGPGTAQEWRIHINGNETYTFNNDLKGYFPILWYSPDEGRGILVGGLGGGVSYTAAQKGSIRMRYQANFQRSRLYTEPTILRDANGVPASGFVTINTNLNGSAFAAPLFVFGDRLRAGFGLGARYTFSSIAAFRVVDLGDGSTSKLKIPDNSIAPLVLFVPVQLELFFNRFSYALRVEPSLTSVSGLDARSGERNLVLFVEVGYRL